MLTQAETRESALRAQSRTVKLEATLSREREMPNASKKLDG